MRVVTPELEAALDRVKSAMSDAGPSPSTHVATYRRHKEEWPTLWRALEEVLAQWPSKNMPQVVTDRRVPPDVIYLTQLECRIPFSVARLAGIAWMRRPIPAGGIPLEPVDLTLADPEE